MESGKLIIPQTLTAMEKWAIDNIRLGIETGKLKSPVPEQESLK